MTMLCPNNARHRIPFLAESRVEIKICSSAKLALELNNFIREVNLNFLCEKINLHVYAF